MRGGRFVLAIKDEGTDKEVWKARFIVQGYRDKLKTSLVHDTSTARQYSIRILTGLAAIFGFRLFSTDVTQAHLQSAENLMRDVFITPKGEFELSKDQLLKLLKPLYGLADSGDYWDKTFSRHLTDDLGMRPCVCDPALYGMKIDEKLLGLCTTCVDDALQAGNDKYQAITKATLQKFKCRDREFDEVKFSGIEIDSVVDEFRAHQRGYMKKVEKLQKEATFSDFRKMRARLAWLTHTRPDICCSVALTAQVTEERFSKDSSKYLKAINAIVTHLCSSEVPYIRYPKLDIETLRLQTYSDASFSTNEDQSSQLGYVIFLADGENRCSPLHWSSHKAKRVTRSVLGSEVLVFSDAFDMFYAINHDLQSLLKQEVPLVMITDSLSLFDIITKCTQTAGKRLLIDLNIATQTYKQREVEMIGFVRTEHNPADGLTK